MYIMTMMTIDSYDYEIFNFTGSLSKGAFVTSETDNKAASSLFSGGAVKAGQGKVNFDEGSKGGNSAGSGSETNPGTSAASEGGTTNKNESSDNSEGGKMTWA